MGRCMLGHGVNLTSASLPLSIKPWPTTEHVGQIEADYSPAMKPIGVG
jgi:hypothetical protein